MKNRMIAFLLLAALALSLLAGCSSKRDILSQEEAYAIVYEAAGVKEADAEDPHFHVVVEQGMTKYNIHFSADGVSYDYYINGVTGEILSAEP